MSVGTTHKVIAQAWVNDGTEGDGSGNLNEFWAQGDLGEIQVTQEDENEIALRVYIKGNANGDVTLYLTVAEASRLAHLIGAVVINS